MSRMTDLIDIWLKSKELGLTRIDRMSIKEYSDILQNEGTVKACRRIYPATLKPKSLDSKKNSSDTDLLEVGKPEKIEVVELTREQKARQCELQKIWEEELKEQEFNEMYSTRLSRHIKTLGFTRKQLKNQEA